jgi:putative acetyltransferase
MVPTAPPEAMSPIIRAAEPGDYEAIRDAMAQPLAQANTLQLPLPAREMWKKRLVEFPAEDRLLVAELDGKLVGNLGLHPAKNPRRSHACSIGMVVHDAWHRRGIGSALLAAGIDLAENWMQVQRLELTVFTDNAAAIALYRKFGFDIEGTLRRYAFRNGHFVDVHTMARLKA